MNNNEITLEELYKGKSTIIKNREFFPTKSYVDPFIQYMSKMTNDFRIQVKLPDQITTTTSEHDLTYNRVLVQAVLPEEYCIDSHDEVIGFLYGLDVKKPIVKIYRGYLNRACTNLSVFSPQWLNIQDLLPGEGVNYSPIKNLLEQTNDFAVILDKMKNTYISRDERKRYLGEWVDYSLREHEDYGYGKVKIAVSTPIDAYKQLFINQDSEYYIPQGVDPRIYDVHEAFTQIITDDKRDILNKFEKTMIVNRLLGVN